MGNRRRCPYIKVVLPLSSNSLDWNLVSMVGKAAGMSEIYGWMIRNATKNNCNNIHSLPLKSLHFIFQKYVLGWLVFSWNFSLASLQVSVSFFLSSSNLVNSNLFNCNVNKYIKQPLPQVVQKTAWSKIERF